MAMVRKWRVVGIVGLVALGGVLTGCGASTNSGSSSSSSTTSAGSKASKDSGCGSKATDNCTPHVAMGKTVRVDALIWNVTGVRTSKTLGDQQYGLGAKADGRFVIVKLKVRSDRNESATLTSEVVQLDVGGNTYKADTDGTVAAIGSGADPLFVEDIGPDATVKSKVVFDVPPSVLGKKVSVRFGELGFGQTKGYINLPQSAL